MNFEELCKDVNAVASGTFPYKDYKKLVCGYMMGKESAVNTLLEIAKRFAEGECTAKKVADYCFGWGELTDWWSNNYKNVSESIRIIGDTAIVDTGHRKIRWCIGSNLLKRLSYLFDDECEEIILEDKTIVTLVRWNEYLLERVVTHMVSGSDLTLMILDTIAGTGFKHFDPNYIESYSIESDNEIVVQLIDGRKMTINVHVE